MKLIANRLYKEIDLIGAMIIFSVGIIGLYLAFFSNWKYSQIGISFTMAAIIFVLIRNKLTLYPSTPLFVNLPHRTKNRNILILNTLFLLIFSSGIYSYSQSLYNRPTYYLMSISFLVVIIVTNSLVLKENNYLTLIKIIMVSLNIQMASLFEFSSLISVDFLYHAEFISRIIENGQIIFYNQYHSYPLMHLLVSEFSILTGMNIKNSMAISISFPYTIIVSIIISRIGRSLFDQNVGTIAALIFGVSDLTFRFGSYFISPTTLGIIFYSCFMYIIFKTKRTSTSFTYRIALISIFSIILLTHTITTFILVLTVSVIFFMEFALILITRGVTKTISVIYLLFVLISTTFYWMFTSGFIGYIVEAMISNLSMDRMTGIYHVVDNPLSIQYFIDYIDYILFFMFSFIGCLITINSKIINKHRFMHMSLGLGLVGVALYGVVFSLNAIVPTRWYSFALISLSTYMALTIISMGKCINNAKFRYLLLILILSSITFFNITDTQSTVNDGTDINVQAIRTGLYDSELISANTIMNKFDDKLPLTDEYYLIHIANDLYIGTKDTILQDKIKELPSITPYLLNKNLIQANRTILIRNNVFNRPFYAIQGLAMIDYDIDEYMIENKFNLIYSSKTVNLYR